MDVWQGGGTVQYALVLLQGFQDLVLQLIKIMILDIGATVLLFAAFKIINNYILKISYI